jgi:hypothetical protein
MSHDGMLTLLQSHDQQELPKQHRKDWASEEEIAPPTAIERDIKLILLDKRLSSRGLGLACESLDDCQDQASIKPATKASNSSSGSPFDAATQQFRKPDVVDRHSSTCRAGVVAESVSGSSGEALERMAVPTCTQHEDPGARALCKPITYDLEVLWSDATLRNAFAPIGSERREIFDAVGLFPHRMPFTRSVITSNLLQTRPAPRLSVRLDRPAGPSDPSISTTPGLAEPTTCAMLPTMEPHINTDRRTSSDFFPRSLSFAKNSSQHHRWQWAWMNRATLLPSTLCRIPLTYFFPRRHWSSKRITSLLKRALAQHFTYACWL